MPENQESSNNQTLGRKSTFDGPGDQYDHAIALIDTTLPADNVSATPGRSDSQSWRQLARNVTSTSVKNQLARRKYAKWQQDRFDSKDGSVVSVREATAGDGPEQSDSERQGKRIEHAEHTDSEAVDFGQPVSSEQAQGSQKKDKNKKNKKLKDKSNEQESAVDILYENQRGSFFCGIPLYSHSSLLNFDPAPWVTKDYKDSAVNITNAQVPDPSWQWAWKHWYVDMSGDVDEDGWQYSFAFFGNFAWHGTHPWFHSFCRRRRWLRKRTKAGAGTAGKLQPSSMSAAHKLNTDYFTIHSKRDRSPHDVDDGPRTARPDSYMSYRTSVTMDEIPDEIDDIGSLLKALRLATIDREKIEYIKNFAEHGGEELAYLKERIPEIMQFLVFQNSKRQMLEFLREKANEAQQHRDEHDAEDRPEGEAESRKIDNLLKAVDAADEQIRGLEYWSDRKHVLQTTEDSDPPAEKPLATIFDKDDKDPQTSGNDSVAGDIKGIADKAGIGQDPTAQTVYRGAKLAPAEPKEDKGKGKAKEATDEGDNDSEEIVEDSGGLKKDEMMVSDDDVRDATQGYSQLQI